MRTKRLSKLFMAFTAFFLFLGLFCLTSCGSAKKTKELTEEPTVKPTVKPTEKKKDGVLEITDMEFGLVPRESISSRNELTRTVIKDVDKIEVEKEYYLVCFFNATVRSNPEGTFDLVLTLNNIEYIDAAIDAYNGKGHDAGTFKDPETATNGKRITCTLRAYDVDDQVEYRVTYGVKALKSSESGSQLQDPFYEFGFSSSDSYNIRGKNIDPKRTLRVSKVDLATPVISYDSSTCRLEWDGIDHADYYLLYVDGEKNEAKIQANNGAHMVIIPTDFNIESGQTVQVKAMTNNSNYNQSKLSNSIECVWD